MLADPLVVKKYDWTTTVNFTKVSSTDSAKFVDPNNTSTAITTLEIRYANGPKRRQKVIGDQAAYTTWERKANVKLVRSVYNTSTGNWDVSTINLTWTYPSNLDTSSAANLKDLLAYVASVPLTAATFAKMLNEEV